MAGPLKPSAPPAWITTGRTNSFMVKSMTMKAMTRPLSAQPIQ